MSDPLKELLAADAVPKAAFPPTSRYTATEVTEHDPGDGSPAIPHLGRRLCPQPSRFATRYSVQIVEADRRDLLAARHLGDPELWWQLADANGVGDPRALTDEPGSTIRITMALDIPGSADD